MKKVFIIHGYGSRPNGGWRPWLMAELDKKDVYACALSMPSPEKPIRSEWVEEIARNVERNKGDEIYLVGHSLGVPAILRYLEQSPKTLNIAGVVLVSGRCILNEENEDKQIEDFLKGGFDYQMIKLKTKKFVIIHGDNDPVVPVSNAMTLSKELNGELIIIKNGQHLNGSAGWTSLPQCLEALDKMMKEGLKDET